MVKSQSRFNQFRGRWEHAALGLEGVQDLQLLNCSRSMQGLANRSVHAKLGPLAQKSVIMNSDRPVRLILITTEERTSSHIGEHRVTAFFIHTQRFKVRYIRCRSSQHAKQFSFLFQRSLWASRQANKSFPNLPSIDFILWLSSY